MCPTEPEWVGTGGAHSRQAITHNPEQNTIKPVFHKYPVIRTESGYVIQLSVSEDKTQVALRLNYGTVFEPTQLPKASPTIFGTRHTKLSHRTAFNARTGCRAFPKFAQMCQTAYPSVYTPDFIEAYGTPKYGYRYGDDGQPDFGVRSRFTGRDPEPCLEILLRDRPVFGFHKVTKTLNPTFLDRWTSRHRRGTGKPLLDEPSRRV